MLALTKPILLLALSSLAKGFTSYQPQQRFWIRDDARKQLRPMSFQQRPRSAALVNDFTRQPDRIEGSMFMDSEHAYLYNLVDPTATSNPFDDITHLSAELDRTKKTLFERTRLLDFQSSRNLALSKEKRQLEQELMAFASQFVESTLKVISEKQLAAGAAPANTERFQPFTTAFTTTVGQIKEWAMQGENEKAIAAVEHGRQQSYLVQLAFNKKIMAKDRMIAELSQQLERQQSLLRLRDAQISRMQARFNKSNNNIFGNMMNDWAKRSAESFKWLTVSDMVSNK
jgi:hypothetical protein